MEGGREGGRGGRRSMKAENSYWNQKWGTLRSHRSQKVKVKYQVDRKPEARTKFSHKVLRLGNLETWYLTLPWKSFALCCVSVSQLLLSSCFGLFSIHQPLWSPLSKCKCDTELGRVGWGQSTARETIVQSCIFFWKLYTISWSPQNEWFS